MLVGETPFYADSLVATYAKIMDHKRSLVFPSDLTISAEAQDLIRRFLTDADNRIGRNGCDDVKAHPFFKNEQWTFETIRSAEPPIKFNFSGDDDTSRFEECEEAQPNPAENLQPPKAFAGNQLPFVGFTYSKEFSTMHVIREQMSGDDRSGAASGADSAQLKALHGRLEEEMRQRARLDERFRYAASCMMLYREPSDKRQRSSNSRSRTTHACNRNASPWSDSWPRRNWS